MKKQDSLFNIYTWYTHDAVLYQIMFKYNMTLHTFITYIHYIHLSHILIRTYIYHIH